jgi:transglutaminase-like putative cysteine protease
VLRPDASSRRRAAAPRRRPWLDHLLMLGALAVLLLGYETVVEGRDWWVTTTLVAGLVSLVCAVLGALAPRFAVPVGGLVLLLVLGWVFAPGTFAGVLPTPATLESLGASLGRAQVLVMEEAAPAAAARPLVLLLAGAFGLLVLVLELVLRLRRGVLLVGAVLVAVYVAPALVSGETPSVWLFLGSAACWLVLLRTRTAGAETGWTSLVPALGVGGSALLVGVLLPPVLPDVTAVAKPWGDPPPQVFGRGINPMLQLGQNLRRNSTTVSATYTTTLEDPPYLKVAMLRDFQGRTWRPARAEDGEPFESRSELSAAVDASEETTRISIADLRSSMLPVPYPVLDVDGLRGSWSLRRAGLTVTSDSSTTQDQRYTVTSLERRPTAEQMRTFAASPTSVPADYTALPADVPPVVAATAREVTADATTDYDRALALQDYFQDDFVYSETAPVAEDYDGNGVGVLGTFLDEKAGYCVHFSSAMAVMARQLGMPSRIAVGYAPGQASGVDDDGDTEYRVTSDDLHAWPEIHFDGVGWVGFEPTPGVGSATEFEEPDDGQDTTDQSTPQDQPSQQPTQAPQRDGSLSADDTAAADSTAPTAPRTALTVALVLLLAAAVPGLVRAVLRRRRLGAADPDPWWHEVEASAVDAGLEVPRTGTPRALADVVAPRTDPDDLRRLVTAVERARFARPGTDVGDERATARRVVEQVRAAGTRRQRLRARLLPGSLWRR